MWYGEMFELLKGIKGEINERNYGDAERHLDTVIRALETDGLLVVAKLKEGHAGKE